MSKPDVAGHKPAVLELAAGEYYWCACGKSKGQPFCDGSHHGSEFSPKKFVLEKAAKVALCQCKRTEEAPFCDGSHHGLE